jgi:hypothetical protein
MFWLADKAYVLATALMLIGLIVGLEIASWWLIGISIGEWILATILYTEFRNS